MHTTVESLKLLRWLTQLWERFVCKEISLDKRREVTYRLPWVTTIESKCQIVENVQNINIYPVCIDIFWTLSTIWHCHMQACRQGRAWYRNVFKICLRHGLCKTVALGKVVSIHSQYVRSYLNNVDLTNYQPTHVVIEPIINNKRLA